MNAGKKLITITVIVMLAVAACAKKQPPVARPMPPPPPPAATTPTAPPPPPRPINEPVVVPPEPLSDDTIGSKSLDDLNRDSPLAPVYFDLDSFDVSASGQQVLQANAKVLEAISDMAGHDRGTLRRARHRGVQPGARRTPGTVGENLSRVARHSRRQSTHRELREGVPLRSWPRRQRVVEESARAFRDHREVT